MTTTTTRVTGSLLVPCPLPEGHTEASLDLLGASEVAKNARISGFTTNGQATRVSDVAGALVGAERIPVPLADLGGTVPAGAAPCRIVTWEATGERTESPQPLQLTAAPAMDGVCAAVIPGEVVSPALLAVRHDLATMDVDVRLLGGDGAELHPLTVMAIDGGEVEVIVPPGTRTVLVAAAVDAGDGADTHR